MPLVANAKSATTASTREPREADDDVSPTNRIGVHHAERTSTDARTITPVQGPGRPRSANGA